MTEKPRRRAKGQKGSVAVMSRAPVRAIDAIEALIATGRARDVADTITGQTKCSARLGTAIAGKMMQYLAHREATGMSMGEAQMLSEMYVAIQDANTRAQHVLNQTPDTQLAGVGVQPVTIEAQAIERAALEEYQDAYNALGDTPAQGTG